MSLGGNLTPDGATPTGGTHYLPVDRRGDVDSLAEWPRLRDLLVVGRHGLEPFRRWVGSRRLGAHEHHGLCPRREERAGRSASAYERQPAVGPAICRAGRPVADEPSYDFLVGFGSPLSPVTASAYGNTSAYQSPQSPFS
eukprot:gnl/Ergobibamus_cyprinoides/560.p3 GENE.gnl/Ergobibamus_cyprinoides/560~~gnl/Ergobibamus_cyprinoides/560.p3  ORF type:complete len:140 (+),score=10.25 gnl/Ergobibamus_cyprinoides/560:1494-1913(+)